MLLAALLALAGFARADHPTYGDAVRANRGPYPIDEADARARHARSGVGRVTGINNAVGADIGGTGFRRRRLLEEDTDDHHARARAEERVRGARGRGVVPLAVRVVRRIRGAQRVFQRQKRGSTSRGRLHVQIGHGEDALGADVAATS